MASISIRDDKATKAVTILVTGFGPFDGSRPSNLSYTTVSTLPTYLPPTRSCQVPVRIIVHPYDVPITYKEIRDLAPKLYDAYSPEIDLWLQVGVRPQQESYSIERRSHRDGYHTTSEATLAELDDDKVQWNSYPDTLDTSVDFEDVFSRWRRQLLDTADEAGIDVGNVRVRKSHDAGHTICDFLYYASLAECWRRKMASKDGERVNLKPILLLQIPETNTKAHIRKARHITISMLRAMAESWRLGTSRTPQDNMVDGQDGQDGLDGHAA